jgi:nicotinamide-nucleotide adenylyltransferase
MSLQVQLETLLSRVKQGLSAVELAHIPHNRWPYSPGNLPNSRLKLSVLDSSFNPPTRAHLALASLPPHDIASTRRDFDARLLLLSVRNADKGLQSTDATYAQRLEMMIRLAEDVGRSSRGDTTHSNVAVAIIDEPTFVGKAHILGDFLRQRISSIQSSTAVSTEAPENASICSPELTFIVGMDTLERILAPRYYPSSLQMRNCLKGFMATSRLICSRRTIPGQSNHEEKEEEVLSLARDYLDMERLEVVDLEAELQTYSSSEVRRRIGDGDTLIWKTMVTSNVAEFITNRGLYLPQQQ